MQKMQKQNQTVVRHVHQNRKQVSALSLYYGPASQSHSAPRHYPGTVASRRFSHDTHTIVFPDTPPPRAGPRPTQVGVHVTVRRPAAEAHFRMRSRASHCG